MSVRPVISPQSERPRNELIRGGEGAHTVQRRPRLGRKVVRGSWRRRFESLAIFSLFFAGYAGLGIRLTIVQHLTVFDAVSRLSHAYFVWYNKPPKLAAIGFVWPPLQTLVFLPLAAIKPLAISFAALPLTSAIFAAATLVVLNVFFRSCEIPSLIRYGLVVGFGLNPMFVFYAVNGMGEAVLIFFVTLGFACFLRWFLSREPRFLILAGLTLSLAFLARYELLLWALILVPVMTIAMIRQRVSRDHLEGALIAYLAPISYTVGLWMFLSWAIVSDPLYFVHYLSEGDTPSATLGKAAATSSSTVPFVHFSVTEIGTRLLDLNWNLFAPTLIVGAGLVISFMLRRDLMALSLAAVLAVNPLVTGVLISRQGSLNPLQLRYNMRSMAIVMLAIAWLTIGLRRPWQRRVVGIGAVIMLFATIPLTWRVMESYPYQFYEAAFTRALRTGDDQLGAHSRASMYQRNGFIVVGEYSLGADDMADYILAHVEKPQAILTDDSKTFCVMLATGRPDIFFDRIDLGDAPWLDVVTSPFGRARFILVTLHRSPTNADLITLHYSGFPKGYSWARPVYVNKYYGLYAVAKSAKTKNR
jgi:hypothetical protein